MTALEKIAAKNGDHDLRQIVLVHQAREALAEAKTIDEVKDIRDKAEAMRLYLKQRNESLEVQNMATEMKLWAERKAGEMLVEMPKNKGAKGSGSNQHEVRSHRETAPKLSEVGVDKNESSRWQTLASIPEEEFEEHIEEIKAAGKPLTTSGVLEHAKERKAGVPVPTRPVENPLHVVIQKVLQFIGGVEAAPGLHSHGWGGLEPYVRGLTRPRRRDIRNQLEHLKGRFQEWIDIIDRIDEG